jgi:hypothetical protein
MNHIINGIRTKLIIIMQINAYIDRQPSILGKRGQPLPCIKLLLECDEGIQRSLDRLDKHASKRPSRDLYQEWRTQFLEAQNAPESQKKGKR